MLFKHEKELDLKKKYKIQKLRLHQQVMQTIFDFNIQISCSVSLIVFFNLVRGDKALTIVHLSLASSLASVANRIT